MKSNYLIIIKVIGDRMMCMFIGGLFGFALGVSSTIVVSMFRGSHQMNGDNVNEDEMSPVIYMKSKPSSPKNA